MGGRHRIITCRSLLVSQKAYSSPPYTMPALPALQAGCHWFESGISHHYNALSQLRREGYTPRRTIKICHWDAGEYNIIGSTEWIEQFHDELSGKAVAYINADMAACGPNFGAAASPSLKQPFLESTKAVLYPRSDHIAFYLHVGIPSAGLGMGGFTPYHTAYYNLAWYERFADPDSSLAPQWPMRTSYPTTWRVIHRTC